MLPLLEVLKERGELSRNDAIEAVVQRVGLTEEQMALNQEGIVDLSSAGQGSFTRVRGFYLGFYDASSSQRIGQYDRYQPAAAKQDKSSLETTCPCGFHLLPGGCCLWASWLLQP